MSLGFRTRPRGYETFFILKSAEPSLKFQLLLKAKMLKYIDFLAFKLIVDILTFMTIYEQDKFHEKSFISLRPGKAQISLFSYKHKQEY